MKIDVATKAPIRLLGSFYYTQLSKLTEQPTDT